MSSSWEDREVLGEVWGGQVPAVFTLSEQDQVTDSAPCYIMLPRMSYLPLATDKVRKHFSSNISSASDMWFSHDGVPLRWHHPIGLLYDLLSCNNPELTLPWRITVHFSQFPVDTLLPCQTRDQVTTIIVMTSSNNFQSQVETVFMSSLKEADQLKHSGKIVSQMQKKDHNQLWQVNTGF